MDVMTIRAKEYGLDRHGFLDPPGQWDKDFAVGMAGKLGIRGGLIGEHWKFIQYLRKKFLTEKTVPLTVFACIDNRLRLRRFRELFPAGYLRGACRIAGLDFAFIAGSNPCLTYENYQGVGGEASTTGAPPPF
jgi:tRNA 2-thiouridine synthesizing protein E